VGHKKGEQLKNRIGCRQLFVLIIALAMWAVVSQDVADAKESQKADIYFIPFSHLDFFWGGNLPDGPPLRGKLPSIPRQFDAAGKPLRWPIPNTIVHWAALLKAPRPLAPQGGKYDLRCRTIDDNGIAQPMPRPFTKSGHNAIQKVQIVVEE